MSSVNQKITLVPLHNPRFDLHDVLPFDLGFDCSVENVSDCISRETIDLWSEYISERERKNISGWSICLVHRYTTPDMHDELGKKSVRLMDYLVAHLRLIAPDSTNSKRLLQGNLTDRVILANHSSFPQSHVLLLNCEQLSEGITASALKELKNWMPWITRFTEFWREYYPLYLSMHFSELAYTEHDPRVQFLLRVMALEALVSDTKTYGKRALTRISDLVGAKTDVYEQYASVMQHLPILRCEEAIADVAKLRNEIAHGSKVSEFWMKTSPLEKRKLPAADVVFESAAGLVALSWKRIISDNQQDIFADKARMKALLG